VVDILDIGYGCDRTLLDLRSFLDDGHYSGMDINRMYVFLEENGS
jgi:hypothetical protein